MYQAPLRELRFVLDELLGTQSLAGLRGLEDYSPELAEQVLGEAGRFAQNVLDPLNQSGDREGAHWTPEGVKTAKGFKAAYEQYVEGGWPALGANPEFGGQAVPNVLSSAVRELMASSNLAFKLGPMLTIGAVEALDLCGSPEQKQRYLPKMVSGELITAIAMTEPGAGSDLQGVRTTARRDGNSYVVNGAKTYITNGQNADLIIVVAKTEPELGARGTSLILVEGDAAGFKRGRNLDKVGQHSADTSELFFEDVRVPMTNCLGEENRGFVYLMSQLPQERLTIAISAQACAQRAFDEAVTFTKDRSAFGKKVFEFQNTKFTLADLKTQLQVGWAHLDWALSRHLKGELTTAEASAAKLWHTEMQARVIDAALQLHGGAGFMNEYMVARLWCDARVTRIYGGTSEIMKEVISRSI